MIFLFIKLISYKCLISVSALFFKLPSGSSYSLSSLSRTRVIEWQSFQLPSCLLRNQPLSLPSCYLPARSLQEEIFLVFIILIKCIQMRLRTRDPRHDAPVGCSVCTAARWVLLPFLHQVWGH